MFSACEAAISEGIMSSCVLNQSNTASNGFAAETHVRKVSMPQGRAQVFNIIAFRLFNFRS